MTRLAHGGVTADLPPGWEGRIRTGGVAVDGTTTYLVLHAGNFDLPPRVEDYGGSAVEAMGRGGIFAAVLEFGPESLGTPLFVQKDIRRPVTVDDFDPRRLQRMLPQQSGMQQFFTASDRPYCLYLVLGSHVLRATMLREVNTFLAQLSFD